MRRSLTITMLGLLLLTTSCGDDAVDTRAGGSAEAPAVSNQDKPDEDVTPTHQEVNEDEGAAPTHEEPVKGSSTIAPQPPPGPSGALPGSAEQPGQGVFGRVASSSGQPIAGAMVQPSPGRDNPAPESEVFATTAADGTYGIALSPGRWVLSISAAGFEPAEVNVTVAQGAVARADAALRQAP